MSDRMEHVLGPLLARLHQGDAGAADAIYQACEAYVRLVVRRHLSAAMRSKFDSLDVVHSVWVQMVREFQDGGTRFTSGTHLLSYLVQAARNRLIDRYRRNRAALEHEHPLEETEADHLVGREPRPSQNAQAEETWQRIVSLCSPDQVAIVQLRRQGVTINEIATRTGFHPSSVRRILYDVARQLGVERNVAP